MGARGKVRRYTIRVYGPDGVRINEYGPAGAKATAGHVGWFRRWGWVGGVTVLPVREG